MYTIKFHIPKQGATQREKDEGVETIFTYSESTAAEAKAVIKDVLSTGLQRDFQQHGLSPEQTVIYPPHLINRITISPMLP